MKNESENTIDVTTKYFKVKNEKTGKYLKNSVVKKMFPPCSITNDYILFARLRPEISGGLFLSLLKKQTWPEVSVDN